MENGRLAEFSHKEKFVYISYWSWQQYHIQWWSNDKEKHYNRAHIQKQGIDYNLHFKELIQVPGLQWSKAVK